MSKDIQVRKISNFTLSLSHSSPQKSRNLIKEAIVLLFLLNNGTFVRKSHLIKSSLIKPLVRKIQAMKQEELLISIIDIDEELTSFEKFPEVAQATIVNSVKNKKNERALKKKIVPCEGKLNFEIKCKACERVYALRASLLRHIRMKHTKLSSTFACHLCSEKFITKYYLSEHLITHSNERAFVCTICDRAFKRKKDLNKHDISHKRPQEFHCPLCLTKLKSKWGFQTHMFMQHALECPGEQERNKIM